jgi:hypothetical protein
MLDLECLPAIITCKREASIWVKKIGNNVFWLVQYHCILKESRVHMSEMSRVYMSMVSGVRMSEISRVRMSKVYVCVCIKCVEYACPKCVECACPKCVECVCPRCLECARPKYLSAGVRNVSWDVLFRSLRDGNVSGLIICWKYVWFNDDLDWAYPSKKVGKRQLYRSASVVPPDKKQYTLTGPHFNKKTYTTKYQTPKHYCDHSDHLTVETNCWCHKVWYHVTMMIVSMMVWFLID